MKIQATELVDPRAEFVSIVTRGANRRPWKLRKDDGLDLPPGGPGTRGPQQGFPRRKYRRKEDEMSDPVSQGAVQKLRQSIKTMMAMLKGVAPDDPLVALGEAGSGEPAIQQFVFSKAAWSADDAADFAARHGFAGELLDEGTVYRAELFPVSAIDPASAEQTEVYRADEWPAGVTAIKALQVTFAPGALSPSFPAKRALIGFPPASVAVPKAAAPPPGKKCPTCGQTMPSGGGNGEDYTNASGKEETMTVEQKIDATLAAIANLPAQLAQALKACSTEHPSSPRKPKTKSDTPADPHDPTGDAPAADAGDPPSPEAAAGDPLTAEERLDKVEQAVSELKTSITQEIRELFATMKGELGDRVEKVERRALGRRGVTEVQKMPGEIGASQNGRGEFDSHFPAAFRARAKAGNSIENV